LVKKTHAVRQDPAKFRPTSILRQARAVIMDHPVRDGLRQRARSAGKSTTERKPAPACAGAGCRPNKGIAAEVQLADFFLPG
jgi:hypothetical protein